MAIDEELLAAERRADDAARRLREARIALAVEREARGLGFRYPDTVPVLIDQKLVTYDPRTGEVGGVRAALNTLLKEMPKLADRGDNHGTPVRHRQEKILPRCPPPILRSSSAVAAEIEADLRKQGLYY